MNKSGTNESLKEINEEKEETEKPHIMCREAF
jgi:hypothetical protein